MTGEPGITVIGNLTTDPRLSHAPSGAAVTDFILACTPRTMGRQKNDGHNGETVFLRASVRGGAAKHAAESLAQGMRVIATGVLTSRSYETKTGEQRTVIELEVEEIAPSLRSVTAAVTRTGVSPDKDPAPHPVDAYSLSAREYADDDRWFGLDANPEGRINTTTLGVSGA